MPRQTPLDRHPSRAHLDRAIVAGEPIRAIAGRFNVSRAAISRRKKRLIADIAQAQAAQRAGRIAAASELGDLSLDLQKFAVESLNAARERGDEVAALVWFDRAIKAGGFRLNVAAAIKGQKAASGHEIALRIERQTAAARVAETFLAELVKARAERKPNLSIEHSPPDEAEE